MLTVDFESKGIEGNPIFDPPEPVGVSIKRYHEPSEYLRWGHPTGNNCSFEFAKTKLLSELEESPEFIAHNAPFECSILRKYYEYVPKDPLLVHDTQFLLFLTDPYAFSFALKPSAERILGLPPDEQDEVKAWVLANVPEATSKGWGAHIWKAPGGLVGRYAGNSLHENCPGDTDRTEALWDALYPRMHEAGMLEAYRREQKLAPILSASSRRGVRLDMEALGRDMEVYLAAKKLSEDYIHRALGDFNIDSDRELAEALDRAGQVTSWVLTPTGKRSTARKNLVGRVRDSALLSHMAYRGVLATCLGTFAGPWLAQAQREGGRLHPQWNQIRGDRSDGGDLAGTRTGRMSCREPNLQNVSNEFEGLIIPQEVREFFREISENLGYPPPRYYDGTNGTVKWAHIPGSSPINPVPHMRNYLLPEEGHVWVKRDFSAQEMRIMAHFAEGKLYDAYRQDPRVDPHAMVQGMLKEMLGIDIPRKYLKIIAFGIMYGRGIPNLSLALGVSQEEGKRFRDAYYALLPEVQELRYDTRNRGKRGGFIRTWGGRVYYREPDPARDLSYKLLNYVVQGSAADQTKESLIAHDESRDPDELLLAAVHDEINVSVPEEKQQSGMRRLRIAMDEDRFDVPFRSEGFAGPTWGHIEKYEDDDAY